MCAHAQQPPPSQPAPPPTTTRAVRPKLPKGFAAKKVAMPDGSVRKYAVFIPPQYKRDESHKWPLILFLHGSGEIGDDGVKPTTIGLGPHIVSRSTRFPFIAVFPQAHALWFRGIEEAAVWLTLDAVLKEYRVDPDRIYLTGLSMGGFATWEMSVARPDLFAAVVPVCGAGPLGFMSNMVHLPVWAFHGAADPNVPVARSRELIEELKQLGAEPRYTEFPGVGHNSWDAAYATPQLWRWLLKQRRKPPPRIIDYHMCGQAVGIWWLAVKADPAARALPPPQVRAEITEDGRLNIDSTNVIAWAVTSGPEPLQPGHQVEVTWNGKPLYKGEFKGVLSVEPESTTHPAER
jgi:predicted esterase